MQCQSNQNGMEQRFYAPEKQEWRPRLILIYAFLSTGQLVFKSNKEKWTKLLQKISSSKSHSLCGLKRGVED